MQICVTQKLGQMGCDVSVSKLIPVVQSRGLQVNDGIWGMFMTAQRSVKAEVGELFVDQDLSPVSVQSLQPQIGVEGMGQECKTHIL